MKVYSLLFTLFAGIALAAPGAKADSSFSNFITAHDGKLYDGTNEFRFISLDIPNLLEIEDNVAFTNENPWRLPDQFEIDDALETIRELGGTATRTYVISVLRTNDTPEIPRYVLAPGVFNETAFRTLDEVLAEANRTGVRLIIPFVDNWPWMGGRAEYAGFRGKTKNDFWTDPQLIADFEQTIRFMLMRTNTVSGVRYRDDKAVLCWETGNEIASPPDWTRQIARYIKSLDQNHLVMDGFGAAILRPESLEIPDVDIVTTHHYPGIHRSFSEMIRENAARAQGKKAYIIGEFGFVSTAQMADALQAIADSGSSGGMLWSLRFRDRDGGFYWHSEPGLGGNLYKAFHWPGSPLAGAYDEINLLDIVRSNAFAIRGLPVPPVPIPAPPHLLPLSDAAAISWQGSVGATGYQVERSSAPGGDWLVLATNVDEAATQYRPLFADENVPAGKWFYRVRAKNESGISEPSNVVGPVKVKYATLVDELGDFSKVENHGGGWQIADRDCRPAREDAQRAAGNAGDELTYQLPSAIHGFRVYAFFPEEEKDLQFFISGDGRQFQAVDVKKSVYFHGAGEYGYWEPVLFHAEKISGGTYLKIRLTGKTQISRVEITHKANHDQAN